ncbi:MAG: ATP-binding cassette domain-containing protein [Aliishimia sp.]
MLVVNDLSRAFGSLTVVDNLSTSVDGGTCLGIMGPNGAGKSTFFDLLTGVTLPDQGTIVVDGQAIEQMPVETRVGHGIARAFQVPKPFGSMTVREHLVLAAIAGAGLGFKDASQRADDVLEQTGLSGLHKATGNQLRLLDRKRLELAKALATDPKVLLLDEISGGLSEHEVADLITLVASLKRPGLAILWIEHIAHALNAVCDRILMLHLGQKIVEDAPEVVSQDVRVRELYLGSVTHA